MALHRLHRLSQALHVGEGQALSTLPEASLSVHILRHTHSKFQCDRVHLALDEHRTNQFPNVVDAGEVIL